MLLALPFRATKLTLKNKKLGVTT